MLARTGGGMLWIAALLAHAPCVLNGDGDTSRDFCHVDNVVQANLLAATVPGRAPTRPTVSPPAAQAASQRPRYRHPR